MKEPNDIQDMKCTGTIKNTSKNSKNMSSDNSMQDR